MQERIYLLTFLKSASMADAFALSFSHCNAMSYDDGNLRRLQHAPLPD